MEVSNIVEGYTALLLKKAGISNQEVEQLASLRLELCHSCKRENEQDTLVNGRCTLCGCVMAAKARALNAKCPVNKW
ncbi:MAG: hypothetical protein ACK5OS_02440 [Chryseotalea sp.]|jgi:hypothetical protein